MLYTIPAVIIGKYLGFLINEVVLFWGPPIYTRHIANIRFIFGFVPISGSVQFDTADYSAKGKVKKLILIVSGVATIFILGIEFSGKTIYDIVLHLIAGISHPSEKGIHYVAAFKILIMKDMKSAFGIFLITMAIMNLLPAPLCTGGKILLLPFEGRISERMTVTINILGTLLVLPVAVILIYIVVKGFSI